MRYFIFDGAQWNYIKLPQSKFNIVIVEVANPRQIEHLKCTKISRKAIQIASFGCLSSIIEVKLFYLILFTKLNDPMLYRFE